MTNNQLTVNTEKLRSKIYTIRNVQVMFDEDLARLYSVKIKRLNEQVKRNKKRFPEEFMFQLTKNKSDSMNWVHTLKNSMNFLCDQNFSFDTPQLAASGIYYSLRSQIATIEISKGSNRKYLPYAFADQGVTMLSEVLINDTLFGVFI